MIRSVTTSQLRKSHVSSRLECYLRNLASDRPRERGERTRIKEDATAYLDKRLIQFYIYIYTYIIYYIYIYIHI